jgi:prevent-host-death family protein
MPRITATDANRSFSQLLARVRAGETAEITVRGEVVARLEPASKRPRRAAAERKNWDAFIDRLKKQPVLDVARGTREELYDN